MGRPNWYYDHPPACTCARCAADRSRDDKPRNPLSSLRPRGGARYSESWLKRLWRKISGG